MDTVDTALYFPYIQVPRSTWFTQVLLYWDATASIVPYRERDKTKLDPYMSQLIKVKLLQPITANLAFRENAQAFDERFLQMLDSREPRRPDSWQETRTGKGELSRPMLQDLGARGLARYHKEPKYSYQTHEGYSELLHRAKGFPGLFEELHHRGLARHVGGGHEWWTVEKSTADLYMDYLVGSICRIKGFWPVTDSSQTLSDLAKPVDNTSSRLTELRYATIMDVLPTPSHPVPPLELARFKEHNRDALRRLRIYLNGKIADLITIDDEHLRQVKTDSILQEIHDDVTRLTEQMSKQRWPAIMLTGVAGIAAAGLVVGQAIATGGTALAIGLGIGAGVASLIPPAKATADILSSPRLDAWEPLAYAALAGAL